MSWTQTKNVRWKKTVPGKGWSSPIVSGGKVLVTTAVPSPGDDHSLRLLCLDAASGKTLWDQEVFHQKGSETAPIHANNSHASPTPLTDGEFVYVHFGPNGTACLNNDGEVIWKTKIQYDPVHGGGSSPVLVGSSLIVSCDGRMDPFVIALDPKSGNRRWKMARPQRPGNQFAFSTPLVIEVKGETQVVSAGANGVSSYDPENGREIWRVDYGRGYSVVPRPVYGHGLLYVCTGFNKPTLLAIRANGRGNVTDTHVVWRTHRGVPLNPSPVLVGNELFFVSDNGIASCLDAETGATHWSKRLGGKHWSSPFHADGKIYFLSEKGESIVIQARKEFAELSRNPLNEHTQASCAVGDGALFIRTLKHLYRIEKL